MSVFGIEIELRVGGSAFGMAVQEYSLAMERMGDEISDFGKYVFPRVGKLFEDQVRDQFNARGKGPVAGGWPALSGDYAKWKAVRFPGMPILEATGRMRDALTRDGGNALREYGTTSMAWGTLGIPYASYHQTGTPFMPARPPVDFGSDFEPKLEKAMQLGVVDAARAARMPDGEVTP